MPNIHEYFSLFDYPTVKSVISIIMQIKAHEHKMQEIAMKEARGEYLKPEEIVHEDGFTQADYSKALSEKLKDNNMLNTSIYDALDWSKAKSI